MTERTGNRLTVYLFSVFLMVTLAISLWTAAERYTIEVSRRTVAVYVDMRDIDALLRLAGPGADAAAMLTDLSRFGVTGMVVPVFVPSQPVPTGEHLLIDEARKLGLDIVPLFLTTEETVGADNRILDAFSAAVARGGFPFALFADGDIDSINDSSPVYVSLQTAQILLDQGVAFGQVEFRRALGEAELIPLMENCIQRVHTISPREMRKYLPEEAIQRYLRAVRERGYRNLWVRFPLPEAIESTDVIASELIDFSFIQRLQDELIKAGYVLGEPSRLPMWSNGWLGIAGGLVGSTLAVVLLLMLAGLPRLLVTVAGGGNVLVCVLLALSGRPILARQTIAFVAANSYAALSITLVYVLTHWTSASIFVRRRLWAVVIVLFLAAAIALLGGLVVTTALGDYRFMLKTAQYLGVKVSFLLPLVWIGLFVFSWDSNTASLRWHTLKTNGGEVMRLTESFWQRIALTVIVVGMLGVYLARSANFALPVSELELSMRNWFEQTLVARPRIKEFLIGYPVLLLGLYRPFFLQRVYRLLLIVGGIAAVSVANTFCHVHTPIVMSLARTVYGLVFGVFLGIVLIAMANCLERVLMDRRKQGVKAQCGS